jgi:hypothetical protein
MHFSWFSLTSKIFPYAKQATFCPISKLTGITECHERR